MDDTEMALRAKEQELADAEKQLEQVDLLIQQLRAEIAELKQDANIEFAVSTMRRE